MSHAWFETRKACPACAATTFKQLYESAFDKPPIADYLIEFYSAQGKVEFEYLEGAVYVLLECAACGLIFQRDIPNDALMKRLYEQWIDPEKVFNNHHQGYGLESYAYYAQEIMQIIAYFSRQPAQLKFFDFGMGWGKWALMAKAFGCESYGTELSVARIKHAIANGIQVIQWDEIPQYRFHFINTEQVFEHIPHPLDTLIHLKTALAPDGVIKISIPTANNIDRRLKIMDWKSPKGSANSLNPVAPLEHINFYRRSSLLKMAEIAGMEETFIPIRKQYAYITGLSGMKNSAKKLILPIYRNLLKRQNYILLRKK